jgi:hypothetical protein
MENNAMTEERIQRKRRNIEKTSDSVSLFVAYSKQCVSNEEKQTVQRRERLMKRRAAAAWWRDV